VDPGGPAIIERLDGSYWYPILSIDAEDVEPLAEALAAAQRVAAMPSGTVTYNV
jgi:hypothetical protein